jgi:hypothetical protein
MEYNRKKAPQQRILEVIKSGEWSKVQYIHKLECGHIEIRKRAASTDRISCLGCVRAEEAQNILTELVRPTIVSPPLEDIWTDDIAEDIAHTEQEIGFLRAGIANYLEISAEAVDVVMEQTDEGIELSYVVVFIDADTARSMAKGGNGYIDV